MSKRLSFIAQFRIDFLLPFTGCRKVLRKMSALGVSRQISFLMLLTWYDWWHIRDALCKELFCFVVVVLVIFFLLYYLHELSPENFVIYIYVTNLKLSLKSRFKNSKISHIIINRKLIKRINNHLLCANMNSTYAKTVFCT